MVVVVASAVVVSVLLNHLRNTTGVCDVCARVWCVRVWCVRVRFGREAKNCYIDIY